MLFLLALLPTAFGALPSDGANIYYCPAGMCLGEKKQRGGFVGPSSMFVNCQNEEGTVDVEVFNPILSGDFEGQGWDFVFSKDLEYLPEDVEGSELVLQCCTGYNSEQCDTSDGVGFKSGGGKDDGKKSMCPEIGEGMVGICIHECDGDDMCGDEEMCCSNGCGKVCMSKPKSKYNKNCPKPDGFGTCDEACTGDDSCEGTMICCSNGCGSQCQVDLTVPRKEGETCGSCYCPPSWTMGECEEGLECVFEEMIVDAPGVCTKTDVGEPACTDVDDKKMCKKDITCRWGKNTGCTWHPKLCKSVAKDEEGCDAAIARGAPCKKKTKRSGMFKKCTKAKNKGL